MPAPSQPVSLENNGQMQAGLMKHGFQRVALFGLQEVEGGLSYWRVGGGMISAVLPPCGGQNERKWSRDVL